MAANLPTMARGYILTSTLWVPRTPQQVFPFFADAANLQELTPQWLSFGIETRGPIELSAGTLIDYRLAVHGLPLRWRTRITRFEPPHVFCDEQLRGPYRHWRHTHTFTPQRGGTELGDHVELLPRGGPLAPLLFSLFVRRDVLAIFRYRLARMAAMFDGDAASGSVQIERAPAAD